MKAFIISLLCCICITLAAETPDNNEKKGGLLESLYPIHPDEPIAEGRILTGVTVSLLQATTQDEALNIIIGDIYEADGYKFSAELTGGYFYKDARAIGMHLGYTRTWVDIDFAILKDIADVAQHRKYMSNGFFVQPFMKHYLKILDSRILYLFNETSLKVGYSYGISQSDDGKDMTKTQSHTWTFAAGLNPGVCIMVMNRFAFEVSVGLLGVSSNIIDMEENDEKHSKLTYNVIDYSINLLALDLSLVYFF